MLRLRATGSGGGLSILLGDLMGAFALDSRLLRNFILFCHLVRESFFYVISFNVMIAHLRAIRSVRVAGSVGVLGVGTASGADGRSRARGAA